MKSRQKTQRTLEEEILARNFSSSQSEPPLLEIEAGHTVACFYPHTEARAN